MAAALLYLTDGGSAALAAVPVAGRPLALRAMVAAARAGAEIVAVPSTLRSAELERLVARTRGLAGRVRWLGASDADAARPRRRRLPAVPQPPVEARTMRRCSPPPRRRRDDGDGVPGGRAPVLE